MRYVSSAYLQSAFPLVTACKSDASTTHDAFYGPRRHMFYTFPPICVCAHTYVYASTSTLFVSFAARCYGRFSRRNQPMRHCRCNAGQVSTPCLTLLPPDITTWRCILSPQLPWPLVDAVGHSAECLSNGTVSVRPSVRPPVCLPGKRHGGRYRSISSSGAYRLSTDVCRRRRSAERAASCCDPRDKVRRKLVGCCGDWTAAVCSDRSRSGARWRSWRRSTR